MSDGAKKNSPLLAALLAGIAVIAVLLGVIVFLLLGRGDKDEAARSVAEAMPEQRAVVVNEDNAEQVAQSIVEEPPVAMGYYEVNMNFAWQFPDGQSPSSNAYVENKATNNSAVYFDVVLAEDESVVLYESPVLPLGTHINEVTLAQDLDAGTYPCVIIYHMIDDQQRTTSTLRLNLEIVVNS
jgi:Sec-independent protein translocase protein TatA